jgi:hypothetical protein
MRVVRLSIPYDRVLAFGGPDPVTGLVDVFMASQAVPVGTYAHLVAKDLPDSTAGQPADVVRERFGAAEHVVHRADLRTGPTQLFLDFT